MGGDFAPEATVLGAIEAKIDLPENHHIVLIGSEEKAREIIKREKADVSGFEFINTTQVIEMGDHATKTMRK